MNRLMSFESLKCSNNNEYDQVNTITITDGGGQFGAEGMELDESDDQLQGETIEQAYVTERQKKAEPYLAYPMQPTKKP